MTILKNPDGSFYPAGFFDFPAHVDMPRCVVMVADIAALHDTDDDKFLMQIPRYDATEFREWCAARNLPITPIDNTIEEGEEVHFGFDEKVRFEFRMRWGA